MNTKKDELPQSLFLCSWAGIVARSCLWSMACCPKLTKEFLIAKFSTGPQLLRVFLTSPSLFQIHASSWLSIWILEPSIGTGCSGMCQGPATQVPPIPQDLKELPVPSVTHIQDALEQHAVPDPPVIPCLHSQVGEPHTWDPKLVVGGIQALKLLVLFWCHETWVGKSNRRGMDIEGRRN